VPGGSRRASWGRWFPQKESVILTGEDVWIKECSQYDDERKGLFGEAGEAGV
jgi:hypothetical protein